MARRTALRPHIHAKLVEYIAAGATIEVAGKALGIAGTTIYGWLKKGRMAQRGVYADLLRDVERAEARCEVEAIAAWHVAWGKEWTSAAAFLERRWPERWGRVERTNMAHSLETGMAQQLLAAVAEVIRTVVRDPAQRKAISDGLANLIEDFRGRGPQEPAEFAAAVIEGNGNGQGNGNGKGPAPSGAHEQSA